MTDLTRNDIRAAIDAGMITEAQAASLAMRVQARKSERGRIAGYVPFQLFRGLNELFIVAGLIVLFVGIVGFTESIRKLLIDLSIFEFPPTAFQNQLWYGCSALFGMGIAVALARYFTLHRRMIAPSIALSVIFFAYASVMGYFIGAIAFDVETFLVFCFGVAAATLPAAGYHYVFRLPFTLELISLGFLAIVLLAIAYVLTSTGNALPSSRSEFLLPLSEVPYALIPLTFGLVFLALDIRYDLRDPERITRRTVFAFLLHIVAAPSLMHVVAPTLFLQGTITGKLFLLLFVLFMALFAIVIDRRIFIISGMIYLFALIFYLQVDILINIAFILFLCLGLINLCAKWRDYRVKLMSALLDLIGKGDLPPWNSGTADNSSTFPPTRQSEIGIRADDIRDSINAGIISEAQAARITELALFRNDERGRTSSLEKPFEQFRILKKIFITIFLIIKEIFITIFLIILAMIWIILSLFLTPLEEGFLALGLGICALLGMYGTIALAKFFTTRLRMVAPSVALAIIFSVGAIAMGMAIAEGIKYLGLLIHTHWIVMFAATLFLAIYYFLFRVPFTMVLIALGILDTVFAFFLGYPPLVLWDILFFLLVGVALEGGFESLLGQLQRTSEWPFSMLTMVLGLAYLTVALAFDMSDPHRVTRRADVAFWMHVMAALTVVNTVAATLYAQDSTLAHLLLVLFVMLMTVLALIIDRRSVLIVGTGYIIALIIGFTEHSFGGSIFAFLAGHGGTVEYLPALEDAFTFALIAALGLLIAILGAQWQFVRRLLMRLLPDFPGKNRLPPWD